jgi:hypothetical protein
MNYKFNHSPFIITYHLGLGVTVPFKRTSISEGNVFAVIVTGFC